MAEPLIITRSLSQRTYPGVGDIDDCVVVATAQAYAAEPDHRKLPTATAFRIAAGVPDQPGPTPMTSTQAGVAARKLWPETKVSAGVFSWANFGHAMEVGRRPASVSVLSSALPANLQFGFGGGHQITAWYQEGQWWMTNPLQPEGTAPHRITASELHAAAGALVGGGNVSAVIFPQIADPGPSIAELQAAVLTLTAQLASAEARLQRAKDLAVQIGAV
jgi:hypothetical protein